MNLKIKEKIVYRYTTKGEGVFSAGKRLLPENLVNEVLEAKKWLKKPNLAEGEYKFYLTRKGKEKYERTLFLSHKKYLKEIKLEKFDLNKLKNIVYQDEHQVVEKID